jgi:hypothetical protein
MSKIMHHRQVIRIRGLHEICSKQKVNKDGCKVIPDAQTGVPSDSLQQMVSPSQFRPKKRNHKGKTRVIVEKLQSILPNIIQKGSCANVNFVLEKTLEYLRSIRTENVDANLSNRSETSDHQVHYTPKTSNANVTRLLWHKPLPIDKITRCKYLFSFDCAPFGMAICQVDGASITSNRYLREMEHGMHVIQSLFSVLTNESVDTRKVRRLPAHTLEQSLPNRRPLL